MRQILEALYYGNIHPNEKAFSKGTEFSMATKALEKSEAFLRGVLNEEGRSALEEYDAANAKISRITYACPGTYTCANGCSRLRQ